MLLAPLRLVLDCSLGSRGEYTSSGFLPPCSGRGAGSSSPSIAKPLHLIARARRAQRNAGLGSCTTLLNTEDESPPRRDGSGQLGQSDAVRVMFVDCGWTRYAVQACLPAAPFAVREARTEMPQGNEEQ